jgi:hypothetical protein
MGKIDTTGMAGAFDRDSEKYDACMEVTEVSRGHRVFSPQGTQRPQRTTQRI